MTQYLVVFASTDNGGLWIKEWAKRKNGLISGRGREERNGEHSKMTKQDIRQRGSEYDVRMRENQTVKVRVNLPVCRD